MTPTVSRQQIVKVFEVVSEIFQEENIKLSFIILKLSNFNLLLLRNTAHECL
jgi:hypothetical protein